MRCSYLLLFLLGAVTADKTHPRCPKGCPLIYQPLCASNGKTYASDCAVDHAKYCEDKDIQVMHTGECEKSSTNIENEKDELAGKNHPQCPKSCPFEYSPLCASNGETFSSLCLFLSAKYCDGKEILFVHPGECVKKARKHNLCPGACPNNYLPVCASDGVTYRNSCEYRRAIHCEGKGIYVVHDGECEKSSSNIENEKHESKKKHPLCSGGCYDDYSPVCASNGVTYPNYCSFKVDKYCEGKDIDIVHVGECEKSSPNIENAKDEPKEETNESCPQECESFYEPLCASNGKTYTNFCYYQIDRCKGPYIEIVHPGRCEIKNKKEEPKEETNKSCSLVCGTFYSPLCASNGKSYNNFCYFEIDRCKDANLKVVHHGHCEIKNEKEGPKKEIFF